jgi:class 3 adenylate cyclase
MERSESPKRESPDAEARHATILKCDLVGSTRARQSVDLGEQLEFQRRFERVISALAEPYGAHIEGFEGDGALVVFGFAKAMEDAAESAVRMGLDLIDAVRHAELLPNKRFQIRVGIASGLIAVVNRQSGAKSDSIAGLTIDLAERLRAVADPDQVVIADSTKRLSAGFFRYEDLGAVSCKGFDEGFQAWRVLGPSPVVSRFEAQRFDPSRGEIIDRAAELTLLSQAWASALRFNGQAVCLYGDAGIGKSRLAKAALDAAVRDGAAALRLDCTPSTSNTPLFPISVLLPQVASITQGSSNDEKQALAEKLLRRLLPDDDVREALPYLAPFFGLDNLTIPTNVGPDELRERTLSTLVLMFNSLIAERPLALLCEDLHWADDSTASLITRLCGEIERQPALIIVTARPSAEKPVVDLSIFTNVDLRPLDPSGATDLVRYLAKERPLPDETVRRIVARCEGNPLVLEEVTRNALQGTIRLDDPTAATSENRDVPAPLQLAVQSRMSRWFRFAPIVQSAAVLGRDFSKQLLEQIVPAGRGPEVNEAIDLMAREGLFAEPGRVSRERARFKHAMICDAVYNTLLGSDRRRIHSDTADVLTRDFAGSPDATPDVIAEHLSNAGRYVESIRMRILECTSTAARGAYVETEGHCVAALALIDNVVDPQQRAALQFRLLIQLGVALTGRHGYSAPLVENTYRRAHAVCDNKADAELLYPIMRGLATVHLVRGDLATAYDLSVQGMELAEKSRRVEFRLDAMSVLCFTTLYYGCLDDCLGWIDRCLQLYRSEQGQLLTYPVPQDAGTAVAAVLPTVLWLRGDAQGAEHAVREGLAHVDKLNREFDKALLHNWISGTRYTQRRYEEAHEHASIAVAISERQGYREWYGIGMLMALLARSALRADPLAIAQATAVWREYSRTGAGVNASYYLWGLARGYAQAGDVETARKMIAEAFERAAASRETRMNAELHLLEAELEPDSAKATDLFGRALSLAEEQGAVPTALRAAALLALRGEGDDACVAFARSALEVLDGLAAHPPEGDWMLNRLAALKSKLNFPDIALVRA